MSVGRGFGCYVCNCATVDCQRESNDYTSVKITNDDREESQLDATITVYW